MAVLLAGGCTCAGPQPTAIEDAGVPSSTASSEAPPLDSAPRPALPPLSSSGEPVATEPTAAPRPRALACPSGMIAIRGKFCVDKWEASLVDRKTGLALSPYYPPDRKLASQLAETWEAQRLEMGSPAARETALPPLPEWQRKSEVDPVAVSKPGVIPNGYLSGVMAARACKNAEKRLCTYEEWHSACRGDADRPFPYGAEYKAGACNIFRAVHPALELHDNASIGHLDPRLGLVREKNGDPLLRRTGTTPACKSAWGSDALWDMNGNLDEWVDDERGRFAGGFYSRSKKDGCESSVTAHPPSYLDYSLGVRCCWSPDPGKAEDPPRP